MLARLARDSIIYGASSFLVRGIQILFIPIYTRLLSTTEYGIIDTISIVAALVNLTVALEISQGVARRLADTQDENVCEEMTSTAIWFSMIAYAIFFMLAYQLAPLISEMLFDTPQWALVLRIASAAMAVNGVFVLMQDLLRWRLRPLWFMGASLSYAGFSIVFSIRLVVFEGYGLPGVFWGQIAGAVAGAVVSFYGLRNTIGVRFSIVQLGAMLKYSLPLVLSSIAVFANQFVDRILVKESLGVADLGVYGVAARLASLMSLLSVGVQSALTPLIYRNQSHNGLGAMVSKAFRFYCAFVVLAIGSISLFSSELLFIFAGPAFYGARFIVPVLAVATVFSSLYMFSPGLFLAKRTILIASINVGAAALNIILGVLLVQYFGAVGAAMAAMIAAVVAFTGFSYFGRRHFAIRLSTRCMLVNALFAVLFVLVGAFWNTPAPRLDAMTVGLKLLVLGIASVVVIRLSLDSTDRKSVDGWINRVISK